jgi:hypothetical protein
MRPSTSEYLNSERRLTNHPFFSKTRVLTDLSIMEPAAQEVNQRFEDFVEAVIRHQNGAGKHLSLPFFQVILYLLCVFVFSSFFKLHNHATRSGYMEMRSAGISQAGIEADMGALADEEALPEVGGAEPGATPAAPAPAAATTPAAA